jgi:putative tributyrin esterase
MRIASTLGLLALLAQAVPSAPADHRFHSPALEREMPYRVLLPNGYDSSPNRRYPVLYLLHGLDGRYTDWTLRTSITQQPLARPLIIVMPEGANSWYVNWHDGRAERWEDYVASDLIAEIDGRFRTDARRDGRFIAGLSMGGYGAIRMGLKHPERYAIAASLSGAFEVPRLPAFGWTDMLRAEFLRAFGPPGSTRRRQDDVFVLAERAPREGLPFFYLDCGTEDPFLESNRSLAAALQRRGIAYEYRETPGAHSWAYWNRQVTEILALIAEHGSARPGPDPASRRRP